MLMEGVEAVDHIHRSHCGKYHAGILELAKLYISSTERLCHVCFIPMALLSPLNTHRLLELCQTLIPLYGHVIFIAEIGFEGNHELLKEGPTKHMDTNLHISAFLNVLFRDGKYNVSNKWMLQNVVRNSLLVQIVA